MSLTRIHLRRKVRRNGNGDIHPDDIPTPEELRALQAAEFEVVEARLLLDLTKDLYRAAETLNLSVDETAQMIGESMPCGYTLFDAVKAFNRGEEW